jgi:hypothetical protein
MEAGARLLAVDNDGSRNERHEQREEEMDAALFCPATN